MNHPKLAIQRLVNKIQSETIDRIVEKEEALFSYCQKEGCLHFKVGRKYCEMHNQRDRHTGKGRNTNKIKGKR